MNSSLDVRLIHLRVADLTRSVEFYAKKLGFVPNRVTAEEAELAPSPEAPGILRLTVDRTAESPPAGTAGLFHAALLLPSRAALGNWLQRVASAGVAFDGFSDHGVSEALYLTDPEGNGLEFYCDRPREEVPTRNGQLAMGTLPLDLNSLLAAGATSDVGLESGILAGSRWGHLHLRVSDLDRSTPFYAAALGMTLRQEFGTGARFLAADGYHHHVGLNTWGGIHLPQPAGALGLIEATFAVKGAKGEAALRDPDGIGLRIAAP